jgi:hypothetical protein
VWPIVALCGPGVAYVGFSLAPIVPSGADLVLKDIVAYSLAFAGVSASYVGLMAMIALLLQAYICRRGLLASLPDIACGWLRVATCLVPPADRERYLEELTAEFAAMADRSRRECAWWLTSLLLFGIPKLAIILRLPEWLLGG